MTRHPKLQEISTLIAELLGLSFPANRWSDLERGVLLAAKELGLGDSIDNFALWLSGKHFNIKQLDVLANHLTVGETYFFREKQSLEIFQNQIIPEIMAERFGKDQQLNIWSAGCCSGEEPYTLAMLLKEKIPDITQWKFSILATDLNPVYLKKATDGIYSTWSFRETPDALRSRYFYKNGTGWKIDESIWKMVVFKQHNLAETDSANGMFHQPPDVIFCRNVLMYFSPDLIRRVGLHFYHILKPQGWFITSPVEFSDELFAEFAKVKCGNYVVYRKSAPKQVETKPAATAIMAGARAVTKDLKNTRRTKPAALKPVSPMRTEKNPESALLESAGHLYSRKRYADCAALCRTEIVKSADKQAWQMLLARSCANSGQLTEALSVCNEMLTDNRLDSEVYYLKSTILAEQNNPEEAVQTLRQGIYLYPDHLMSHLLMAEILRKNGNAGGASKHLKSIKRILSGLENQVVLEEAGGLTVGRIRQMVESY